MRRRRRRRRRRCRLIAKTIVIEYHGAQQDTHGSEKQCLRSLACAAGFVPSTAKSPVWTVAVASGTYKRPSEVLLSVLTVVVRRTADTGSDDDGADRLSRPTTATP